MIIGLIFLLLCAVETVIIWFKWNEISEFVSIGKVAAQVLGYKKEYTSFIDKIVIFFVKRKDYIWIPITLIAIVNFITAIFLAFIVWLIQALIFLF